MKKFYLLIILFPLCVAAFSQFNPATNSHEKMEIYNPPSTLAETGGLKSFMNGLPCDQNSFWAVGGGQVISFTLNGNTVTNNGSIMPSASGSLAYCNNLDGGSFSPTFYSTASSITRAAYYNGTGWATCSAPPTSWVVNTGGNGDFLYYTSHDSVTHNEIGIVRYNGSSYNRIYTLPDTSRAITVADLAVDNDGNVWFFTGVNYNYHTDTLNVLSPSGQFIKKFPFA